MIPPSPNWLKIWSLKGAILVAVLHSSVTHFCGENYIMCFLGVFIFGNALMAKIEPWDLEEEK